MRYNNTRKRWQIGFYGVYGIIYIDSNYIEFGYFEPSPLNIPIEYESKRVYLDNIKHCSVPLFWNNANGLYTLEYNRENNIILESKHVFNYPINKCYNFSKLNLRATKVNIPEEPEFKYIKSLTFGLEYETAGGNIPWLECLNNNLVPLYDGSITGHEYVTFPLKYTEAPLIKKHLELLNTYTRYDINCSLHIHFGGFPIEYNTINKLCQFWSYFQESLQRYIPAWSYYVERYKPNGKAYNRVFPKHVKLNEFYERFTGNAYENDKSFYLPNLYDVDEVRKWEVHGRYFNMNIMHLLAGPEHKTVEFRFLRPTTNYNEIKWYILVLGAFLNYVANSDDTQYSSITIKKVINFTFPVNIANKLITEGTKIYHLYKIQENLRDYAGLNDDFKSLYLSKLCKFSL